MTTPAPVTRAPALERLATLLEATTTPAPTKADPADRLLPAPAALAHPLPEPSLRRSAVTEVLEDAALLIALECAAGAHGHTAVLGMPEPGLPAAVHAGPDPTTILPVDHPGRHWQAVTTELARAVDVLILGSRRVPGFWAA